MTANVAVVVLNWNNAAETLECLASLRAAEPDVRIVAVDNGSAGDDADVIERSGRADVVVRTGANLGFTGGNNRGLARALGDGARYVAVLNNDTRVESSALTRLVAALAAHDGPAAASPRILRADDDSLWFAGGVVDHGLPRHLAATELAGTGVRSTELLTGCCLVADRATWQRVGLFDERYFLFFEDSDWSARARAAGVELIVVDDAVVRHGVSRSFTGAASMLGTYYYARNGVRYHRRYARRYLPRFLWAQVVAPPVRGWRRRGQRLPAWPYGWFGALSGLLGLAGPAPRWLERRAGRSAVRESERNV